MKETKKGLISGYRCFSDKVDVPTKAAFGGKFVGSSNSSITLVPGKKQYFVLPVRTWAKISRPLEMAKSRAFWMTEEELGRIWESHQLWWRDFWDVSQVELDDPVLEQRYYLSQYVLASVSRDPAYPPNILGICTFDRMAWNGNYKINYNHQSPYLGLMASGHFEQSDPHDAPYLDLMDIAKEMSRRILHHEGVYLPLGLGPVGMVSESLLLHMKSPAIHGAVNMMIRYELTKDREYAKRVYPFLQGVALFWEKDLVIGEDGKYRVVDDGMHERDEKEVVKNGVPENATNTLGYLKAFFRFMPEISADLGIDTDKLEKWIDIRDHLSDYSMGPVGEIESFWRGDDGLRIRDILPPEYGDKVVFYNEEKGGKWSLNFPGNIMQIYPAGDIGLDSPPALLEAARNTIEVRSVQEHSLEKWSARIDKGTSKRLSRKTGAWNDGNISCLFFPAAVRVGYDPLVIWEELRSRILERGLPNGYIRDNPHGIENLSTVPNTIQEMMLLSHEHVLRIFRVWPKEAHPNACFSGLWAYGAFQVSAALKDGIVCDVEIISRKGNRCVVENPWQGREVEIIRVYGGEPEKYSGDRISFDTREGERIQLCPAKR